VTGRASPTASGTVGAEPAIPSRIGARYQVIEQLGRGGMAVVYRVRDANSARDVALKQLTSNADPTRNREVNALFEREFHTLSQLKHPSVIAVYDYGVEANGPYYTMELLDGGDLTTLAPLPYRTACRLLMQVCSSLSLLHSRRLLHRDISPRNVRCTPDGNAKLIDFGAMAVMGPSSQAVGTPAFIAPEVVHHLSLDARTDLFSLGATLYFALTGRLAFAPRAFSELRDAWRIEPAPPSDVVAEIPAALDDLVSSLLRIDPARRPRSAFEVMQRLAAIAGCAQAESPDISQAYLSTPTLVGREAELRHFQRHLRRVLDGQGGTVLFEGLAGAGRSRLLDACVLEAKILGATVLRASGSSATGAAFASAHELTSQLLEALPEPALRCARELPAASALVPAADGGEEVSARLLPLAALPSERYALQAALAGWFSLVSREQPIVIAVDDAERIDEASLALIAALAHGAARTRLSILVSVQLPEPRSLLALGILRSHAAALAVSPLTAANTEALFASVFGNVPHVALVSDRIQHIARGNPRESLALAQYLVDKQLIRYADGNWMLPAELAVSELPANAEEALNAQLATLQPLARRLAQLQALDLDGPWTRADYAELAGASESSSVDEALAALLHYGVLANNGTTYSLFHRGTRSSLIAQLSAGERAQHHLVLADLCLRSGRTPLLELHHLLQAGAAERALVRLAELLAALPPGAYLYERAPELDPKLIAAMLERAFELARTAERPPRELRELGRQLIGLSVQTDNKLYYRYAAAWLEQLAQDSGLADYRAASHELDPAARLKSAIERTLARYSATPEAQRGYRLDEAIKYLAQYVTTSIVIGSRASDTQLLAALPGTLEPFAALSPVLHALWQNVIAGGEMNYKARPEQARARVLEVYARLADVSGADLPNVNAIRNAIAYAMGALEVSLGYLTAPHWIEVMQNDAQQQVNAIYLRRLLCIYDGDTEGAESFRRQAEVMAVQASSRQMFDVQFLLELSAQVHAGDLAGIGVVADRIAKVAVDAPGWQAQSFLAQGHYQRLRGGLAEAKHAFERALALADPDREDPPSSLNAWVSAAAGYTMTLIDLDLSEEARRFGLQACEQCRKHDIGGWSAHVIRALAIAEAKLGDYVGAAARLDRLIEQRAGIMPSRLLLDYEARARVAIWAKDSAAAERFTALAASHSRAAHPAAVSARHGRLQSEAKQAGLEFEVPMTAFESSVLGSARPRGDGSSVLTKVASALGRIGEPSLRARRALEMLCESTRARAGRLYVLQDGALTRAALLGDEEDAALDESAAAYWRQQLADSAHTMIEVAGNDPMDAFGTRIWTSRIGTAYRFAVMKGQHEDDLSFVGLVAMAAENQQSLASEYWELSTAIGTRLLELGDAQAVTLD
jgi:tRNA A-37 threonylcarbamoyl transferase component Bud32